MQPDWQRFRQEAQRIHERYLVEVVERFNFCPWAKDARLRGRIRVHVVLASAPDPRALLAEIDVCMRDERTDIGMLLCPFVPLSRRDFAHLVAELRAADERRAPRGAQQLAYADFHPIASPDLTTAERLVPFLRCSPDPMVQIVRIDVLARARRSPDQGTSYVDPSQLSVFALDQLAPPEPSMSERIALANQRAVTRAGVEQVEAVIHEIRADRDRTYAALGVDAPTHAHIRDKQKETD